MIIALKNAGMVNKPSTTLPSSKLRLAIAELLVRQGYLDGITKKGKGVKRFMELSLAYKNGKPRIVDVRRVSKPSRRIYKGVRDILSIRQGHGLAVYSTPAGLLTGSEARKANVGGELLFTLW